MTAGLSQISASDHEDPDHDPETCRTCLQRRGHYGILSWAVDTPHDHFVCSYVSHVCLSIEITLTGHFRCC